MKRVRQVTLLVTHGCNLHCSYCYVRESGGGDMTLATAKACVLNAFAESRGAYDLIEFTFLGGEPFLAFPLMRDLSEWIWNRTWDTEYRLTAVTNGTLLRDEAKKWLTENRRRFFLTLSYDGPGDAQNRNRSGSDGKIDLDFFRDNWPDVPVKMTVSEESAPHMAEDIIALRERGIPVNDTFAGGCGEWSGEALAALERELRTLCDYELSHESRRRSDLLSIELRPVLDGTRQSRFSCGAGKSRVTYDYDGTVYACHLLSPLALSETQMEQLRGSVPFERPERCQSCVLDPICPSCDGNSFRQFGRFGARERGMCALFQRQTLYACRYQAKRILRKPEPDAEDAATLAAIQKIILNL